MEWTTRDKKHLIEKIGLLSQTEHDEIFKIIQMGHQDLGCDTTYTQNNNGIFINITNANNDVMRKVDDFVDFCLKNKDELDEYDKRINECKLRNDYTGIMGNIMNNNVECDVKSSSLAEVISQEKATLINEKKEDFEKLVLESKKNEKLSAFVNMLEDNIEHVHKKKGNMKYINAKKKFGRKLASEKKNDMEHSNILEVEPYVIEKNK
jgi:hypothetical protein